MPKSKKRKGYLLAREKAVKLKNGLSATKTSTEKTPKLLTNSKSSGNDSSRSETSSGKSNASEDVEIIDRQAPKGEAPAASQGRNDVNMNDNDLGYAMKEIDQNMHKLFDRIRYSEDAVSTLPNRSWAIHCTELPVKKIVVSEMIMHNVDGSGLEPFYIKQIVFDEKLNFDIFLLNSRTVLKDKPSSIHSMEDFETLLDHVQSLKLCSGGPDYQLYSHITPECAYKDPTNKWRHNLCTLEVNDCDTCESCLSLDDILKRHAQRVKPSVKHKNGIAMTRRKRPGQSKDT
ncbi:uncharacterized protein LOC107045124 [Diachasma alloeum]|uniref:uncharacterized protein LOC107045124 n=1 Tax=Diachasma alloeum TaxID=454923 RepID=UPI0007383938|nr:uncharacterized protein LOC107045124 [Diachasma alloeum]